MRERIRVWGGTQRELAKRLGVGEAFISMIADNKKDFSRELAQNAAHILGCRVEELNEWHEVSLSELRKGRE